MGYVSCSEDAIDRTNDNTYDQNQHNRGGQTDHAEKHATESSAQRSVSAGRIQVPTQKPTYR